MLSPAATHRPESTPFAQSIPLDPIDHPPHRRRFHPTATAVNLSIDFDLLARHSRELHDCGE